MFKVQQNIVQKTKPSGWTLIELLVVMSIISMLTAMLLPSLNRAREQAKRIDCSSNLRQLTFAWYAYTVDNDGRLCSPDTNWNDGLFTTNRHHWVADGPDIPDNGIGGTEIAIKNGVLWPYTKTADLYKCKSDWTDLLRSYSLSNTMGGYDCKCGNMTTPFLNYAQISRSPERMVFIGAHSSKGWIVDGFWPISDIDPEVAGWAAPSSNNITISTATAATCLLQTITASTGNGQTHGRSNSQSGKYRQMRRHLIIPICSVCSNC